MGIMIGVVVLVFVVVAAAILLSGNKNHSEGIKSLDVPLEKKKLDYSKVEKADDLKRAAEEKRLAEEKRKKELEVFAAQKSMYQFLNHSIKMMHQNYSYKSWDKLTRLEGPGEDVLTHLQEIKQGLSHNSVELIDRLWSCIEVEKREDAYESRVKDSESLKDWYLSVMLPFYPYYADILDSDLRYNALLAKNILFLFHELTGKKFRIGYKNRYSTGVNAYEADKDTYKVYDPAGNLLCDATFAGDKIIEGYAILPVEDKTDEDWKVYLKGQYKDGQFVKGLMEYKFQK